MYTLSMDPKSSLLPTRDFLDIWEILMGFLHKYLASTFLYIYNTAGDQRSWKQKWIKFSAKCSVIMTSQIYIIRICHSPQNLYICCSLNFAKKIKRPKFYKPLHNLIKILILCLRLSFYGFTLVFQLSSFWHCHERSVFAALENIGNHAVIWKRSNSFMFKEKNLKHLISLYWILFK